jgi:hypothetical protein
LYAEEIYLNGVPLSQASRRLESTNGAMSGVIEELSTEQKTQALEQKAMRTLIEKLEAQNDAFQIKIQELEARLHAKGTDN